MPEDKHGIVKNFTPPPDPSGGGLKVKYLNFAVTN